MCGCEKVKIFFFFGGRENVSGFGSRKVVFLVLSLKLEGVALRSSYHGFLGPPKLHYCAAPSEEALLPVEKGKFVGPCGMANYIIAL